MELSRLEMDSVLLFRDARVDEKFVANSGNIISEVWIGFDIVDLMVDRKVENFTRVCEIHAFRVILND
jgi:hypothetical protein